MNKRQTRVTYNDGEFDMYQATMARHTVKTMLEVPDVVSVEYMLDGRVTRTFKPGHDHGTKVK